MTPNSAPSPTMTEIDGQRVIWAPSAGPRYYAGLVFRVGQADEVLTNRGITHLLEHLVLDGTEGSVDHNGQTDLFTTTFTVSGTLEDIDAHLARVVANLASLGDHRIEVEKQILAAEADGRNGGIFEALAGRRYGATGVGLSSFGELGLRAIDATALRPWAREWFTRENAICVVVGPSRPERPAWRLPSGEAKRPPQPSPATTALPSFGYAQVAGPAVMAELERSPRASVYAAVVDRELMRRVRGEQGLAYRASAGCLPISADLAS